MINFNEGNTLLIDKPLEWTSFDVVKKIRGLTRAKKVGHAGTLDPLATGLLIICTGKFTKKLEGFQGEDKVYTGTFKLGATTPSYDLESEEDSHSDISGLTIEQIHKAAKKLTGTIDQLPPIFSAIKINGERAYEKARKGETPDLKTRSVTISRFEITKIELPEVHFEIECTKGTYIRSIARDLGELLGCGAYLTSLRRTRIGEFDVSEAQTIEQFEQFIRQMRQG